MIIFCAECEHENEFEVLSATGMGFEYRYKCENCGYEAVEESDLDV